MFRAAHRSLCLAGILCLASIPTSANAGVLSTTGGWDGVSTFSALGEPTTATVGQTFNISGANADTILDSFSFWLDDLETSGFPTHFAAYVMEWSQSQNHAVDNVLWQSTEQVTVIDGDTDGLVKLTFETGGLELRNGHNYVAFLSSTEFFDGNNDGILLGYSTSGDGNFTSQAVYINNGDNFSKLTQNRWSGSLSHDFAFEATFSNVNQPVPEPSSLVLCGIGTLVVGMVTAVRRKHRSQS